MSGTGQNDWYRNTEWNDEIAAAFHAKLARARSQKPQYLVIQAGCLARAHPQAALVLIGQYFATGDTFHASSARNIESTAYLAIGKPEDAVAALKRALAREEEFPNFTTNARLSFPSMVALKRIRAEYDYALEILNLRFKPEDQNVPLNRYIDQGVRALIADDLGDRERARDFAQAALEAADDRAPVFAKHPGIGLVESTDTEFGRRIKRIAKPGVVERLISLLRT